MSQATTDLETFPFASEAQRWEAVLARDPAAEGHFVFAVQTTGIFCRATCPARRPRRENVRYFGTSEEAAAAGYRPCKRCRPTEPSLVKQRTAAIVQACRLIEQADAPPSLAALAAAVGMSPFHFHRLFKAETGVTPKAYATAQRHARLRREVARQPTVTSAIYEAGFASSGRFYAETNRVLGMTPQSLRSGGRGMSLKFGTGECWLGAILVAMSDKGVCAILLGADPDALVRDLENRFPAAELIHGDAAFASVMARAIQFAETPARGLDLPLDIRGTAFQQRVWELLRKIPAGSTATYSAIAAQMGQPKSTRAVASACAANSLAIAIPCHRVVRTDGSLSGYRWGIERKRALLERERR